MLSCEREWRLMGRIDLNIRIRRGEATGKRMGKRRRVGLILGAGGITGGAWLAGMLPGITAATGSEPGTADLVVGTSAGSVMAALIASRLSARHLTPPNNDVAGDWPCHVVTGGADVFRLARRRSSMAKPIVST